MEVEILTRREPEMERLLAVWEGAVRATHAFLREEDIRALQPMVREALAEIPRLCCCRDEGGAVCAFVGIDGDKIEMLFVDPGLRGGGIGKRLLRHAVEHLGARRLDVNEQNPQAVGFYRHMGFVQTGRSELDGQGNPFPLLQMELAQ